MKGLGSAVRTVDDWATARAAKRGVPWVAEKADTLGVMREYHLAVGWVDDTVDPTADGLVSGLVAQTDIGLAGYLAAV